jgi:hypothetical protein
MKHKAILSFYRESIFKSHHVGNCILSSDFQSRLKHTASFLLNKCLNMDLFYRDSGEEKIPLSIYFYRISFLSVFLLCCEDFQSGVAGGFVACEVEVV